MDHKSLINISTIILAFLLAFITPARGIDCYQCKSVDNKYPFQCNEFLSNDITMRPVSCDHLYGAQYCVKRVGHIDAWGIKCYQCTSRDEWTCGENLMVVDALQPTSCEYLYEAKYCIKSTGLYGGGIGTERFCSSKHMGNNCEFTERPGDVLEYRTCVYTCDSDGCNPATKGSANIFVIISLSLVTLLYIFQR